MKFGDVHYAVAVHQVIVKLRIKILKQISMEKKNSKMEMEGKASSFTE